MSVYFSTPLEGGVLGNNIMQLYSQAGHGLISSELIKKQNRKYQEEIFISSENSLNLLISHFEDW